MADKKENPRNKTYSEGDFNADNFEKFDLIKKIFWSGSDKTELKTAYETILQVIEDRGLINTWREQYEYDKNKEYPGLRNMWRVSEKSKFVRSDGGSLTDDVLMKFVELINTGMSKDDGSEINNETNELTGVNLYDYLKEKIPDKIKAIEEGKTSTSTPTATSANKSNADKEESYTDTDFDNLDLLKKIFWSNKEDAQDVYNTIEEALNNDDLIKTWRTQYNYGKTGKGLGITDLYKVKKDNIDVTRTGTTIKDDIINYFKGYLVPNNTPSTYTSLKKSIKEKLKAKGINVQEVVDEAPKSILKSSTTSTTITSGTNQTSTGGTVVNKNSILKGTRGATSITGSLTPANDNYKNAFEDRAFSIPLEVYWCSASESYIPITKSCGGIPSKYQLVRMEEDIEKIRQSKELLRKAMKDLRISEEEQVIAANIKMTPQGDGNSIAVALNNMKDTIPFNTSSFNRINAKIIPNTLINSINSAQNTQTQALQNINTSSNLNTTSEGINLPPNSFVVDNKIVSITSSEPNSTSNINKEGEEVIVAPVLPQIGPF